MISGQQDQYATLIPPQTFPIPQNIPPIQIKEEIDLQPTHPSRQDEPIMHQVVPQIPQVAADGRGRRERAIKVIRQMSEKYLINLFKEDIERIADRIDHIDRLQHSMKNVQETAGAILFHEYFDFIGNSSLRQFCQRNNLSTGVFNKKYKTYYNLFIKSKEHQKIRQMAYIKPLQALNQRYLHSSINNPTSAISKIYDYCFRQAYYQANRRQIIEKLVSSYHGLNRRIIQQITWIEDKGAIIYYVIFNLFVALKAGILFQKFKKAVDKRANLKLNDADKKKVGTIFKKYYQKPNDLENDSQQQFTIHQSQCP